MPSSLPIARPSSRFLAAFIGFIVLFATIIASYILVDAARMKWQDPTWTGNAA